MRLCKLCNKDIIPSSVSEHMVMKHNNKCFEYQEFCTWVMKMYGTWFDEIEDCNTGN